MKLSQNDSPCGRNFLGVWGWLPLVLAAVISAPASAAQFVAGAAKVDITNREAGPVNDTLWVKALVLGQAGDEANRLVIITVDAVAIAEIGSIKNEYLGQVRDQLAKDLKIQPSHVLVNASHCHGIVCGDVAARTVQAVKEAAGKLVPVRIGVGSGHEDRIMENRRVKLKNGQQVDMRRAYSLAPDEEVAEVGPVDPQIGVIRLDKQNGETLAIIYNFACHPIKGVPSGGNTADMTGFASNVIEDCSDEGTIALFLQGCGGDINPVAYKDVDNPPDAEPLGNLLGLSTLKAARKIQTQEGGDLKIIHEILALPRADLFTRIETLQAEQLRLLQSLKGTNINLKTFLPLAVKYNLYRDFPSFYSHRYLQEDQQGRDFLNKLDAENRRNMKQYISNIYVMEELTRVQTNLALLNKHQAENVAAGKRTVDVEVLGIRIGECVLVSFPGELTVRIGLNIKQMSPHKNTFVSAYSNGYIYYAPTSDQLVNVGSAQEDCDCILAPQWQAIYEEKVLDILKRL